MSFFGEHPPINALTNFDIELQYVYSELLLNILKKEKLKKIVLDSLGQERIRHIQKIKSKVSLQTAAYIFRYGPCYTSAVANHMLRLIKGNPFIFRDALWKRCVNVCCFGSASVLEIVAICKIFSLAQDLFWESARKPLQINVAIIGCESRQWKKATTQLLQVLLKMNNILDTSKIAVRVQHVKSNPTKLLNGLVVDVLKEADIVTMVKLVSAIRVETVVEQLLWEVSDCMKIDSVLFFLDTGMIQHCRLLQKVLKPLHDFQKIYGPNNMEPFTLNIRSIQKNIELFWTRFQGNICLTSCIVNSCAWVKFESITRQNETKTVTPLKLSRKAIVEKAKKAKQEWCENMVKSQKALQDYHQQVRHILLNKDSKKKEKREDDFCFLLDYPNFEEKVLFKSKSKRKRINLDERV